jgi:hypothetical protein
MKEFNADTTHFESAPALDTLGDKAKPRSYAAYIGLDVYKETLAVSVARAGREAAVSKREIANPHLNNDLGTIIVFPDLERPSASGWRPASAGYRADRVGGREVFR